MNPKRLWILAVVCVYAGCASNPPSETGAVVSDVLRDHRAREVCQQSQIRYCEHDVDGKAMCACKRYEDVFGPTWGPASQH